MKREDRAQVVMLKLRHHPAAGILEARSGGGCIGCFGIVFGLWACFLGSMMIAGWRAGDFEGEDRLVLYVGGALLITFFLAGMGVGTYRWRFRFDANRRKLTCIRQIYFVPYSHQRWSIMDFEAVELWLFLKRKDNVTSRIHIIRLLPAKAPTAPAEPLELGSGGAGREMREMAREIAEFWGLPLREPPAKKQ